MTNRRMMDYGETDNDDTKKTIIYINKNEAEYEIQELVSIPVPADKTDKNHDVIGRYKAFQISRRDAEDDLYDLRCKEKQKQEENLP